MKRVHMMTTLRAALHYGYIKTTLDRLDFCFSEGMVYAVAAGRRKNSEVQQELYWLALENTLDKLLKL